VKKQTQFKANFKIQQTHQSNRKKNKDVMRAVDKIQIPDKIGRLAKWN